MATVTLTLRGDQIGRYQSLEAEGNNANRVVTLEGTRAIGRPDQTYSIIVEQVNPGQDQFENGQFVTILDSAGRVVMPRTVVQPDIQQGLGAGDEHLIFPGTRVVIDIGGLPATSTNVVYTRADEVATPTQGDNDGQLDFADVRTNFPCFAEGTRILTPDGERPVETLRDGDRVVTRDLGVQPIRWIRARTVRFDGGDDPRRPILIAADTFGPGAPHSPLALSPQHRVLGRAATGDGEMLLPAKGLLGLPGTRVMRGLTEVRYHTILTPRHQIIMANGLWCETFYPGRYMLTTLDPALRDELCRLIPLLKIDAALVYGAPARPVRTVGEARALASALMPQIGGQSKPCVKVWPDRDLRAGV